MLLITVLFIVAVAMSIPLWWLARSNRRLTWTSAIGMATWLVVISTILIAEIPSQMLKWFDANYADLAERYSFLRPILGEDTYIITRDVVTNTVQGIFFIIIVVLAYLWGERQRKAGRFKA